MSDDQAPPGFGDRTVIRPNPGGRASTRPEAPAPGASNVPPPPRPGETVDLNAFGATALSSLLEAAMPLLLLATGLRGTRDNPDVASLHAEAVRQVQAFEQTAQERGVAAEATLAARYALCTFVDEVVMNTPWGATSLWAGRPLLLVFHRDTGGGEKLFQMVGRVLADRAPRRDLIEFFYVCLALGFQGRYRVADGGQTQLAEIRPRLFARIREWRDPPPDEPSAHWRGVQDRRHRLVRQLPAWVFVVVAVVIGGGTFFTFHTWLNRAAAPVLAQLNDVRQATFQSPVGTARAEEPTLAEPVEDVAPGRLLVERGVDGGTTLVLLGEVFASGGTEVADGYHGLLERIGEAVERVSGRLQVEGHSDNVPIRSLRFKDNYELSRQRAENAAAVLRERLSDPARVGHVGIGPDEPRFRPPDDPENRARNRRIEIVHQPGGNAG